MEEQNKARWDTVAERVAFFDPDAKLSSTEQAQISRVLGTPSHERTVAFVTHRHHRGAIAESLPAGVVFSVDGKLPACDMVDVLGPKSFAYTAAQSVVVGPEFAHRISTLGSSLGMRTLVRDNVRQFSDSLPEVRVAEDGVTADIVNTGAFSDELGGRGRLTLMTTGGGAAADVYNEEQTSNTSKMWLIVHYSNERAVEKLRDTVKRNADGRWRMVSSADVMNTREFKELMASVQINALSQLANFSKMIVTECGQSVAPEERAQFVHAGESIIRCGTTNINVDPQLGLFTPSVQNWTGVPQVVPISAVTNADVRAHLLQSKSGEDVLVSAGQNVVFMHNDSVNGELSAGALLYPVDSTVGYDIHEKNINITGSLFSNRQVVMPVGMQKNLDVVDLIQRGKDSADAKSSVVVKNNYFVVGKNISTGQPDVSSYRLWKNSYAIKSKEERDALVAEYGVSRANDMYTSHHGHVAFAIVSAGPEIDRKVAALYQKTEHLRF